MLKIFLVEDEFVVREGIKKNIDWSAHGYEFCGEASDGELAFPLIQKFKPDIVITDIRMPFMDGLELSRLIKKELPWTEIIILTGFEEFEYAKEAIKIGVAQYLSKPINGEELLREIDALSLKIREKKKERELKEKYLREMGENVALERRRLFQYLMTGEQSVAELLEMGNRLGMDISAPWYNVVLAKVIFDNREPESFSNHMLRMEEQLDNLTKQYEILLFDRNPDGRALIFKGESQEELEQMQARFIEDMKSILQADSRYRYFIGIGNPVARLRELSVSFESANHVFARRYMVKDSSVFDSASCVPMTAVSEEEFDVHNVSPKNMGRGKIREFMKIGNRDEAAYFVEEFFRGLGTEALRSTMFRQYIVMDAYFCIAGFVEELELDKEEIEAFDAGSGMMQDEAEAMEYITRILTRAVELREGHASNRYADIVDEVKAYIEKHYGDEDLSLNVVASKVNFSPNHLSMIFSQETGNTFIKYLTDYRMNKARELLRCTGKKSSVISTEVGYRDPHYFSYLFKKTTGMTPTQFRDGMEAEGEN